MSSVYHFSITVESSTMDISAHVSLLAISTLVCSAITLLIFFFKRHPSPTSAAPTLPKPYPIIGNIPHLIKNGHRLLDWSADLLSASPTATVTVAPFIFTTDPAAVEHTARSHFASYEKGLTQTTTLHDFLGHGIFNANGDTWRLQRKTASFEFNTRSLRTFVLDSVRRELHTRLLPLLAEAAQTGKTLDLQDVLERFAFDNICSLVFDYDPAVLGSAKDGPGEKFYRAFDDATHLSMHRWSYPFHWIWKLMRWMNTGSERRLKDSIATVHDSIEKIVRQRRTSSTTRSDLLSRFADSGEHSDHSVQEILISFLIAGRDTTPSALTWFFWLLSSSPRVTDCILEEIKAMSTNAINGVLSLEELRGMQYLHSALTESMRLYPPVSMMPRECVEDDVLPDGTEVKKGWTVMYSTYAMGRTERVWGKGCAEFRPERWMVEGVFKPESSSRYPVFHAGPRVCLGKEMAYIQMKAVVAAVVERFEFEVVEERGEKEMLMTMRMVGGLPVRVNERNA